ncbi:hypothetical protein [Veillonella caviae]|uniref:hypothetical protein n=1 Tax=Veillonella caviae TaxID=248316 RepID=UPI000F8DFC09|nr:hypothetical protein [Veillonella caviae]
MKKLLITLLLLISPITLQAISINDIKGNSDYKQIDVTNDITTYLDMAHTEKVGDTKDLAIIQTKLIAINYSDKEIYSIKVMYTYKKDRSKAEIEDFVKNMNAPEAKTIPEYFVSQLKLLDSGVTATKSEFTIYNFDGKYIDSQGPSDVRSLAVDVRSKDYTFASALYNYIFKKGLY